VTEPIRPQAAWEALADTWDAARAAWSRPVAERLVAVAGLHPGLTVLDAGCGTGAASLAAARAVTPGGWVLGADWAPAMVARARQHAARAGITSIGFVRQDVTVLRYAPGLFDAVIASMVVPCLTDPRQALASWRDLLSGKGRLAFSWVGAEDPAWQPAFDAVNGFLPAGSRWPAGARRWTVTEAEALLPPGLTATTVIEPFTTRYTDREHWWRSARGHEPALAWSQIPASRHGEAKRAAFAVLAGLQRPGGSLERTRTVCYTTARPAPPADIPPPRNGS